MTKWRKIVLCILATAAVSAFCALFTACNKDADVVNYFVVDDTETIKVTGKKGADVTFPEVSKEGYFFKGWYLDSDYIGMAVTSATFEKGTTYYAKWAQGYVITLELEGGELDVPTLYLEEGASIATFMQSYVPTYGDYQFGGWYVGDEPLEANARMTTSGITLTARYKAEYTVNVYLQNIDDETQYTEQASYATGYALIDEEFSPVINVQGFTYDSSLGETELIISGSKTNNVFELYYNRNEYTLTLSANLSDNVQTTRESHLYEEVFDLPANPFGNSAGYRFLGWATTADATYADIITDTTYYLLNNTVLYAVWNKGYSDMFSGRDYIFLDYNDVNTAILSRGGIDITGTYNEIKDIYTFSGADVTLSAKLNAEKGTFVYYTNRKGSYSLFENSRVYDTILLTLDDADGCTYVSRPTSGEGFVKTGKYYIDEDGFYYATVTDAVSGEETVICFLLGVTTDTAGNTYNVFKIRGEEYSYGKMGQYYNGSLYYPVITLDGFGYASYQTTSSTNTYYYTIADDIVTLSTINNSKFGDIRVKYYDSLSAYCYEIYDSELDNTYIFGTETLTLDGCSSAEYFDGTNTVTGTYVYESSLIGDYIVKLTANGNTYVFVITADSAADEYTFTKKLEGYVEYSIKDTDSYLILNGDGTASVYEKNDSDDFEAVSTGNVKDLGYAYSYSVMGSVAAWAELQYTEITLVKITSSSSVRLYILSTVTGEEEAVLYATVYTDAEGAELSVASGYAVYKDKDGNIIAGIYTSNKDYIRVTYGSSYYYFTLTESAEGNTFVRLASAPIILQLRKDGVIDSKVRLIVSGTKLDEDRVEAVYAEEINGETVRYNGYYTYKKVTALGVTSYVYYFESSEKSFKFTVAISSLSSYFVYYDSDSDITLATFIKAEDEGTYDKTVTVVLTDSEELIYTDGDNTPVRGKFTSETVYAFDKYETTVYTFVKEDDSVLFKFTLKSGTSYNYFHICGTGASYEAADGRTLVLDGDTHIARYTDSDYNIYEQYYWATSNILDDAKDAVYMSIGGVVYYFDLDGDNATFTLRGREAATYFILKNGFIQNATMQLNGYGSATVKEFSVGDDGEETTTEYNGTYSIEGVTFTVTLTNGKTYIGQTGNITISNTAYNAFFIEIEGLSGSYLNESDLSVLVLDAIGNAAYYDSMGVRYTGQYVILSDKLFYYYNNDGTFAAMYTYSAGKVVASTYSATYYSDDFASIVFYESGLVLFNNNDENLTYYSYDAELDEIYLYTRSDSDEANVYGFVVEKFAITDGVASYKDSESGIERTYNLFDGGEIELRDESGNTLTFTPTGDATFTVKAVYAESDSTASYYLIVGYDDDGTVKTYLADYKSTAINGGRLKYNMMYRYGLEISLSATSFKFDDKDYVCGLTAYDYNYIGMLSYYGSAYAKYFANDFGYLSIQGTEDENGDINFTLSGGFNYVTDSEDNPVTFTDGTISRAGYYYNSTLGNLYTCEFVGSDGETYHISFYLTVYNNYYCYIVFSLTKVTDSLDLGDGTVIYSEELVYTLFSITKSTEEDGTVNTYVAGDEFMPTLKYKGELISSVDWDLEDENEWTFYSYVYSTSSYEIERYIVKFTPDVEGQTATVVKLIAETYSSADGGYTVYAWKNAETGDIYDVYGIVIGGSAESATECTANEDGSFTVTTAAGSYTVKFVSETNEEGETTVTVTVEKIDDETNG